MLYVLFSLEDPYIRSRPICWVKFKPWKEWDLNEYDVNCWNTNLTEYITIAVVASTLALHALFHSVLSRVDINSTSWPASIAWVFIVQLVHFSVNADGLGSNPSPKFSFGRLNWQLLNLRLQLRWSYLHLDLYFRTSLHIISTRRWIGYSSGPNTCAS